MALEMRLCIGHHSLNDFGCRFDGMDQSGRFAKPHAGIVRITLCKGLPVARTFHSQIAFKRVFTAMPTFGERVAGDACGESSWPGKLARYIRHPSGQGDTRKLSRA